MRIGRFSAARLAFGVVVLALAGASPAAATSLESYWELQVEDIDGEGNCKIREHTLAAVFQYDGGTHGRLGKGLYKDIEIKEGAVSAEVKARWDGLFESRALTEKLNAEEHLARFEGRVSEDGSEIVGREVAPCALHRDHVLEAVRHVTNAVRLKRVDLAITLVQRVDGAWREVGNIDFGRPFHVEMRASRALSQAAYPVTLAWLEAPWVSHEGPAGKETAMTMRRVGEDATLYRSGPIEVTRIADGAPGSSARVRDGVQVLELASGTKVFATAGSEFVPMLAATARVGWLFYVIAGAVLAAALALLGGLGFGVMKAASFAAAKLGLGRRAVSQSMAQAREPDAPAEAEPETESKDETKPDAQPDFSATAHRDGGTQRVEKLKPGEAPVIRFRAGAGQARSSIDLETTAV